MREPAGVTNRRGLFYKESSDLHEDDEMVVQRALHGENGPINADELERRLDEELRKSKEFSFPVCFTLWWLCSFRATNGRFNP